LGLTRNCANKIQRFDLVTLDQPGLELILTRLAALRARFASATKNNARTSRMTERGTETAYNYSLTLPLAPSQLNDGVETSSKHTTNSLEFDLWAS
jgi:hypothetical protein